MSGMLALFAEETPIWHVYGRPGSEKDEVPTANPRFENRVQLGAELSFFRKTLKVKLPMIAQLIRTSGYQEGARYNDGWMKGLWVYPELRVAITRSTEIGVAYSANLVADAEWRTVRLDTAHDRVAQLVFEQSL